MRKLSALLVAICAAVTFSSCLKTDIEIPPTSGGLDIYQTAKLQNDYYLFCVDKVFRLGVIVEELAKNPTTAIKDLTVKIDGKDVKLIGQLFSNNTNVNITSIGENMWEMAYTSNATDNATNAMNGTLVIETNGQKIGGTDARWTMRLKNKANGTEVEPFTIGYMLIDFGSINIANTPMGWSLSASSFGVYDRRSLDKSGKSKWVPLFTLKQSSGDQSFEGMRLAQFELSGSASGNPTGYTDNSTFTYEIDYISPLKYKYCSDYKAHTKIKGFETVNAPIMSQINPENYPASKVTVLWGETADCKPYFELNYNGHSISSKQ